MPLLDELVERRTRPTTQVATRAPPEHHDRQPAFAGEILDNRRTDAEVVRCLRLSQQSRAGRRCLGGNARAAVLYRVSPHRLRLLSPTVAAVWTPSARCAIMA